MPVCVPLGWLRGSCLEEVWVELGHVGAIFPCTSTRPLVCGGAGFGKRRGGGWISVQHSEELDHLEFEPSLPMLSPFEEHKRAKLCAGGWGTLWARVARRGLVGRAGTSQPRVPEPLFASRPAPANIKGSWTEKSHGFIRAGVGRGSCGGRF